MNSRDLNRDDWDLPWGNDNWTVAPQKKTVGPFWFRISFGATRLTSWYMIGECYGDKTNYGNEYRRHQFLFLFFSLHDTFTEWKFSESFLSVATITRIHQFCHGSRKPLQADPFKTETKRANQFLNWRRKDLHVVANPSSLLRRTHVDSMLLNLSRVGTTPQWVHS